MNAAKKKQQQVMVRSVSLEMHDEFAHRNIIALSIIMGFRSATTMSQALVLYSSESLSS